MPSVYEGGRDTVLQEEKEEGCMTLTKEAVYLKQIQLNNNNMNSYTVLVFLKNPLAPVQCLLFSILAEGSICLKYQFL